MIFKNVEKFNKKDLKNYFELIVSQNKKRNYLFSANLYKALTEEQKFKFVFYCRLNDLTEIFMSVNATLLHENINYKFKDCKEKLKKELKK